MVANYSKWRVLVPMASAILVTETHYACNDGVRKARRSDSFVFRRPLHPTPPLPPTEMNHSQHSSTPSHAHSYTPPAVRYQPIMLFPDDDGKQQC